MAKHYTKKELKNDLAELDLIFKTKTAAGNALEFIINKIKEKVKDGYQVDVSGLCSFKPGIQVAKTGLVPGTTKTYSSPAKSIVKIIPAKPFKDMLNV